MKQHVDVVVSGGMFAEQLAIEGVGQPGQRMPVGLIKAGECPLDRLPMQPRANVDVVGNVAIIIEIDEGMMNDGLYSASVAATRRRPRTRLRFSGEEKRVRTQPTG